MKDAPMSMAVVDFTPALTGVWDAFVRQHPHAGYGHLAANFALAAASPGLRNVSLLALEGETVVGVLPLIESRDRAIRVIPVRELMSGALFPGGPLIDTAAQGKAHAKILESLLDSARARATAAGADRITVIYPNVSGGELSSTRFAYSPLLHYGYRARPGVGLLLDLTKPLDALAAGRDEGCRRNIKKAEAAKPTLAVIRDRTTWLSCYDINVQTLGALAYSQAQLAAIWEHFIEPGLATAQSVSVDGSIVAVNVSIHWNGSAYYWIGWNRRPPVRGASHLALWSSIVASRERGCHHFELGSLEFANTKNMGISRFKQSFGGVPHPTIGAELDLKPLKSAAVAFAQAAVTSVRQRVSAEPRAENGSD